MVAHGASVGRTAADRLLSRIRRIGAGRLLFTALSIAFFSVFCLFPFVWMATTAFRPSSELYHGHPFIIREITLENFQRLLTESMFLRWAGNTVLVAVLSSVISIGIGVPAAYSLGRLRYKGGTPVGLVILATYLIPPMVLFIPLGQVLNKLAVSDTLWALVIAYPTQSAPFIAWMLSAYFKGLPGELSDAARVDGANRLQALLRIELPLVLPGLVAVFFFTFTRAWTEYLYSSLFVRSQPLRTLVVGVSNILAHADLVFWGQLMAAALLGAIPVVVIYVFIMDFYVSGLTAGAVRG